MKILLIHNYYKGRGGEKVSFEADVRLLKSKGHQVIQYTRDNLEIDQYSKFDYLNLAKQTIWSNEAYRDIQSLIKKESPDIAHFNNTFPLISPAGYYACNEVGVPVVQTIHNYRLMCPGTYLSRDNQVCELCIGKIFPWPSIYFACYRNSRPQTAVSVAMLQYHRLRNTWNSQVDAYIALTNFGWKKLIRWGVPEEKLFIKPNFIEDPGKGSEKKGYCIYVGRLSPEKGLSVLIDAFKQLPHRRLKIVGDGPLREKIEHMISCLGLENIELVGGVGIQEVLQLISASDYLIFPTLWYETFGRVVIEAYACGVPVIVSKIGAVEELVIEGETGFMFEAGNSGDLVKKIIWMNNHPREVDIMGKNARKLYEELYTPDANYQMALEIYDSVMNLKR